jgi:WD40 repeat protein
MPRLILLFLSIMPAGCGWYYVFNSPSIPEYRQPSEAEIEQMTRRMMGQAPKRDAPVSKDGVQVVFQTGHAGSIRTVALSPNGRYIASSGQDAVVKIWDVAGGQEIRTLTGYGMLGADRLVFSADSTRLMTAEMTSGIKVIELATGREILTVGGGMASGAALSDNGRIAVGRHLGDSSTLRARLTGADQSLAVIDLQTGQTLWSLPDSQTQSPIALSPDGKLLLTLRTDMSTPTSLGSFIGFGAPDLPTMQQEVVVWDVPGKKVRKKWPITKLVEGSAGRISPDSRWLLREDHTSRNLILTDLETGKPARTISTGASGVSGMTNSLVFSPDGKLMAFASNDGTAKLIEIETGRVQTTLPSTTINFSRDGKQVVLAPENGGAPFLRELSTGKETRMTGGGSGVTELAVAEAGRLVVAAMEGGSAKLWELATGQIVRTFDCPGGVGATSVSVSRSTAVLATGCADGSAWLWDLNSGGQLQYFGSALPPGEWAFTTVRITPDGRRAVVARRDQLTIWDAATGKEIRRIVIPQNKAATSVAMLGGQEAGDESMPPQFRVMKDRMPEQPTVDPALRDKIEESASWVRTIAIHPDGNLVAVATSYNLTLWDLTTGKQVRQFRDTDRQETRAERQRQREQEYQQALDEATSLKSLLPSVPFGLGGSSPPSARVMMGDEESDDLTETWADLMAAVGEDSAGGGNSVAFSADGRLLVSDGVRGKGVWDVATGKAVRPPKQPRAGGFDPTRLVENMELNVDGLGVAFSPDGRLSARGHGEVIKLWEVATGQDRMELIGHTAAVKSVQFLPDGRSLISGGHDGAVRIWDLQTGKERAALIALGQEDFVTVTPDQYYRASKTRAKGVAFRVKGQLYPFEQFDLRFNRPDMVLARLGMAPPELIQSYKYAYAKRLRKMGLTEQMLGIDFHLPELQILTTDVPVSVNQTTLALRVKATDSQYTLDRIQVYVNDIAVHGTAGLPLQSKQVKELEQEIRVPLVPGRNKIQISVFNHQGTESLRETVYTTSTAEVASPDVYVVGIGVSDYKDKAYNLRYAAKDAADLMSTYKAVEQRPGVKGKVHLLDLTNQKATKPEIRKAKEWLKRSKINDLVVVFAAGHGMTDEKFDYYFGTHDIDPKHPAANGLPYEDFENLLDGIPALQKVLLLDTCFSGEIDKDQAVVVAQADTAGTRAGTVKMRSFKAARGVSVVADQGTAAGGGNAGQLSPDMLRFQQDWFADLRRGTGAAVISSSSGNEYSLEGEQWKNGVFTYALLNGLKNHGADINKDQTVTVSELQGYVIDQVRKLTQGGQNPTVRRENLEYDFAVY